jgi:hypothetical protein
MYRKCLPFLLAAALLIGTVPSAANADSWFNLGSRAERGSGDVVSEEREVDEFDRIRLDGSPDLIITIGDERSVTVTTDDNLQDRIIAEVIRRGTLLIDTDGSYRSRRGVLVEITTPSLTMVEVNGSGDVEIIDLMADHFELELSGSGDVELEGEIRDFEIASRGSGNVTALNLICEQIVVAGKGSGDFEIEGSTTTADFSLHGSGDLDARRLQADDVVVRVYGSGDAEVFAETDFEGAVYGSGDIDVFGNPRNLDRHVSGSGDIRRR